MTPQARRAREHRAILRKAARLLGETAGEQKESCEIQRTPPEASLQWACADCQNKSKCPSRQRYDELLDSANKVMLVVRRLGK